MRNGILINTGRAMTNGNRVFLYIFRNNAVSSTNTNWTHTTSAGFNVVTVKLFISWDGQIYGTLGYIIKKFGTFLV